MLIYCYNKIVSITKNKIRIIDENKNNILSPKNINDDKVNSIRSSNLTNDNLNSITNKRSNLQEINSINLRKLENNKINIENTDKIAKFTTHVKCLFHDFRDPLNNITLGIDILETTIKSDNINYNILQNIKNSSIFISKSLDLFLNFKTTLTNIENIEMKYTRINIISLIKKIISLLFFNITEKEINIKYIVFNIIEDDLLGDEHYLQHVFYNLLSNAIKFSIQYATITIFIKTIQFDTYFNILNIGIIDENSPIPLDIKKNLFTKYKTSGINNGTGLGLFLSKQIIELHNGQINHYYLTNKNNKNYECDSNNNFKEAFGNIFMLTITFKINDLKIISTTSSCYDLKKNSNDERNFEDFLIHDNLDINDYKNIINNENKITDIICVIDDSKISRKLLIQLITSIDNSFKMLEGKDGLDAILKTHDCLNKIAIIFMDNFLPTMNGPITTKIIRKLGFINLIIGITGNDDPEDIKKFYDNGADYILIKPCTKIQIIELFDFINIYSCESLQNKQIIKKNDILCWN